jgi:hypothetical protein
VIWKTQNALDQAARLGLPPRLILQACCKQQMHKISPNSPCQPHTAMPFPFGCVATSRIWRTHIYLLRRKTKRHIWRSWDRASWYIYIVNPTRCTILRVYWNSLYMFRTVFPSIIRSSRLYIQHQVYVIQVRWQHASRHLVPASMLSTNLYDINLMYVQSWTPDDGWHDRLNMYSDIQ